MLCAQGLALLSVGVVCGGQGVEGMSVVEGEVGELLA